MIKRILSFCFLSLMAFSLAACGSVQISLNSDTVRGSGHVISETRSVSGFDKIEISNSGEAAISVGDSEGITIEAEDNILPLIETTVQSGRLVIQLKPNTSLSTARTIRYTIHAKTLTSLVVSGSVDATVSAFKADGFTASTSGSGNIKLEDLQANAFNVSTSGSGDITAAGKVDTLTATTSGSGDFSGSNLTCGSATATTSGSGNITLWVKDTLDAHTSGSGDIKYYGQPTVSSIIIGSGRVSRLGNK